VSLRAIQYITFRTHYSVTYLLPFICLHPVTPHPPLFLLFAP